MKRWLRSFPEYCPHPPSRTEDDFHAGIFRITSLFSIHVMDFQSTLDGTVAYAIFFSLLFLSSLVALPTTGLAELYRDLMLRVGLVTALALTIVLLYAKFWSRSTLQLGIANAMQSLLASILAVMIWGIVWILFGELTGTYRILPTPTRFELIPLALCVGILDGLIVYAYCTERFVTGIGKTLGILISSLFGWLLFIVASTDFALYLLPIVVVLTYAAVRTGSPLGPIVATGLLLVFSYAYSATSPWALGSGQAGYWLVAAVSLASALFAGFSLRKIPLGGGSHGRGSAI